MLSYAHIILTLIMPSPKHLARALHVNRLLHQGLSTKEGSNQATKYQSYRITKLPRSPPTKLTPLELKPKAPYNNLSASPYQIPENSPVNEW